MIMAVGKFDLSKIRAERVTNSHADADMDFIDKMNSAKPGTRRLVQLPLSLLDANPHQEECYPVSEGEYESMANSMAQLGQIEPIHVIPAARGRYQILAGHRRVGGARLLGWKEIDCFVEDLTPNLATAVFHATNLDRQELKPSQRMQGYLAIEKALQDEAALNSSITTSLRTTAAVAERTGDNIRTIQRYKHLSSLIPDFLLALDNRDISLRTANELSDLTSEEQQMVWSNLKQTAMPINFSQAQALKNLSKAKLLNEDRCKRALAWKHGPMPTVKASRKDKQAGEKVPRPRMIKLPWENLKRYFPDGVSPQEIEQTIYDALLEYRKERETHE